MDRDGGVLGGMEHAGSLVLQASKKPLVIDLVVRTIGSQLALQDRPKFSDTGIMVGEWQGFRVSAQFDSAYLHALTGPYWVRVELSRPGRTHCVVRYHSGDFGIVSGGAHDTPTYSGDLEFLTDRELEQVLLQTAALIGTWSPESETA